MHENELGILGKAKWICVGCGRYEWALGEGEAGEEDEAEFGRAHSTVGAYRARRTLGEMIGRVALVVLERLDGFACKH